MNLRRDADAMTGLTGLEASHRASRYFDGLGALDGRPHADLFDMLDRQVFAEPTHGAAQSKNKPHQADDQMRDQSCRE